ncbi:MAG: integration host factor subunit beta [Acidobacteria bacterium]|nr:integration host factor subunit beta [Acidobacteriota bacterium]
MIKSDIVNVICERLKYNRPRAEMAVEELLQIMKDDLKTGERIELRGFGVFLVRAKKTGVGRNPKTGEQIPLQPGRVIKFKPSKDVLTGDSGAPAT